MAETKRRALKIVLKITCQLLWLVGLVVGLSGVYLLLNYRELFFSHAYIILPAVLALVSASFLLASGVLACLVSIRESVCLQAMFVYLLVMVFCLEATAAALAYYNTGKIDSDLAPFRSVFQKYTGSSQDLNSSAVDATQEELQCCGIQNYTDWIGTPWFNHSGGVSVPHSCCNSTFRSCNGTLDLPWQLYSQGCEVKLEEALQFVLSLIIWSSLAVALVEIVGFVSVAQLMKDQPLLEYRILDRE